MNCYIHVPFCRSKCGYCAFYSIAGAKDEAFDAYLTKIADDLETAEFPEALTTLYIGGGTPTIFDHDRLERFISTLQKHLPLAASAEISIEANPETLDSSKIRILQSFVTRLSLGVQSFSQTLRQRIGRQCSQAKLLQTLGEVSAAKFQHFNCDLIYMLPGQTVQDWQNDLNQIMQYPVDHLSCYSLTAEENSTLGWSFAADDDFSLHCYQLAGEVLEAKGIRRYEISNYAKPGCECRHNLNVWQGGRLLNFGPGAAGFDGINRAINPESLDLWLAGAASECDRIAAADRLNEIFAVNLRTVYGWDQKSWANVPHADSWTKRLAIASKAAQRFPGFVICGQDNIRLSPEGLLFWNEIAETFI